MGNCEYLKYENNQTPLEHLDMYRHEVVTDSVENFDYFDESINLISQANLDPHTVEKAIQQGRIPGIEIFVKGGPISQPQGELIQILNKANLDGINLNTPQNSEIFLNGIEKVAKVVKEKQILQADSIESIAEEMLNNFLIT